MKQTFLEKKEETVLNVFKLKTMLQDHDTLAILIYGSPDPDAVASAMALRELLQQTKPLSRCDFVATEQVVRLQNAEFIREMKVEIKMFDRVDLADYRLLAIVDAQPTFFGEVLGEIRPQIVLDHHPCRTIWHASLADVRADYGALSTIMTEYLLVAKTRISKKLHTALLYGIRTDTNNFERDARLEDIHAYYFNFMRANRQLIRRIELNQIPDRFLKYFAAAHKNKRRYRDRIVCFLGSVDSGDACVQIADFYIRVINVYHVVIAGLVKDRFVVVFRGDGYRHDCGAIAVRSFGGIGAAGGHRSAARVEMPLETIKGILGGDLSQDTVHRFIVQQLRRRKRQADEGG